MGQGTDSCGGWEGEYDPYAEGLAMGDWTTRDGSTINVSQMSVRHLQGARHAALRAARLSSFSSDADMWQSWVDLFDREISKRPAEVKSPPKQRAPIKGSTVLMVCHCGNEYEARVADVKRGYGLSCTKSCAAYRRVNGCAPGKPKVCPRNNLTK